MAIAGDSEFVAFDVETTGLSPFSDRIVEFGAVRFRADGTEIERLQILVHPGCSIPAQVSRIHGITNAMVRSCPALEDVLPKIQAFLSMPKVLLLAHNASFDVRFLTASFRRHKASMPTNPVVDLLQLVRHSLPALSNHRLETVARHLRIANTTEHRALADAVIVRQVFHHLLQRHTRLQDRSHLFGIARPLYFELAHAQGNSPSSHTEVIQQAIDNEKHLEIIYDGGTKGSIPRRITPLELIGEYGRQYVIALCHVDGEEKHFRLDRLREVKPLDAAPQKKPKG